MKKLVPTKSLKISEPVHTRLKVHVARTKGNMTEFADIAIAEKLKSINTHKELKTA